MEAKRFEVIVQNARRRQDDLLELKGADYTGGNADRLHNFKDNAKILDIDPETVWAVYFMKHIAAIMTYVKDGKVQSENITGRIDDAINYLYLLEGLIEDKRAEMFPMIHGTLTPLSHDS